MKKSYSELLLDPRWQKKRLQILERDKWTCQSCENDTATLHVHHVRYDNGLLPWEYDDFDLITLCDECHKVWHVIFNLKGIAFEFIIPVARLADKLEYESMQRFFNKLDQEKKERITDEF